MFSSNFKKNAVETTATIVKIIKDSDNDYTVLLSYTVDGKTYYMTCTMDYHDVVFNKKSTKNIYYHQKYPIINSTMIDKHEIKILFFIIGMFFVITGLIVVFVACYCIRVKRNQRVFYGNDGSESYLDDGLM